MEWIREGEVSFPRTPGEPDSVRAWRPWVLEEAAATLRMWYTGSDGTTSRIPADGTTKSCPAAPGTYTVTEQDPAPRITLDGIECMSGDEDTNVDTRTVTIPLARAVTLKGNSGFGFDPLCKVVQGQDCIAQANVALRYNRP